MKKFIVVIIAALAFVSVASAQPRAIGVRATYGAELSYQHSMGSNFLECDLGWSWGNANFTGIYDFILASGSGFNFYAGPGAALSLYDYVKDNKDLVGLGIGVAGQFGLEYEFSIPLNVSLDWRPVFNLIGNTGFGWNSIALGLRYRF